MWVLGLVLLALGVAVTTEYLMKRGKYRPPSAKEADEPRLKPVLGMEATDVEGFRVAMERNAMLSRANDSRTGAPQIVIPERIADDETYAARYHRAFGTTEKDRK